MKKVLLILLLASTSVSNVYSYELVCKGHRPQMRNQTPIYVNCANRKEVIDKLGAAWKTLRKEGIGGSTEDLCWKPYKQAKELHPSISFEGIAPTFFMQCNMALQYVK